jgi:O-antigen/teichoic acid export membrane protein
LKVMQGIAISPLFTMPLWPKFSEAVMKRDKKLTRIIFKHTLTVSFFVGLACAVFLMLMTNIILEVWVGMRLTSGSFFLLIFAFWALVYNVWAATAAFVGNESFMHVYVKACIYGASVSLLLKLPFLTFFGVAGIILASSVGIFLSAVIVIYFINGTLTSKDY